jgi:hypothetical protein
LKIEEHFVEQATYPMALGIYGGWQDACKVDSIGLAEMLLCMQDPADYCGNTLI